MKSTLVQVALLCALSPLARAESQADPVAQARAVIDKSDAAFNAHDPKGMAALLDKEFFGAGSHASSRFTDLAAAQASLEKSFGGAATVTRERLTLKADESGDVVWFVAEYTVSAPAGGKGMLRESGVLLKRKSEWRFAMLHASMPLPDPAPAKK